MAESDKMTEEEIKELVDKHSHLASYLKDIKEKLNPPEFYKKIPKEKASEEHPNFIYPTKGSVFIHIYRLPEMDERLYHSIEPEMDENTTKKYKDLLHLIVKTAPEKKSAVSDDELKELFIEMMDDIITIDEQAVSYHPLIKKGLFSKEKMNAKIKATSAQKEAMKYALIKEQIGGGPLEPFMRDIYLEDIHIIAGENVHVIHKVFDMIKTNILIPKEESFAFARKLSEKMGAAVSEAQPIVDATMPDGSRGNLIYPESISIKGPSITIRKFAETPISITQIINWGTMSSGIAAYIWLSLQYGRSFFVCGETASGKTTTTNALIPFIPPDKKIYTAENTPELHVPHTVWQQLLTRTADTEEGSVDLFDLLKAALRSRPDYIIPGETRGAEGNVVFQAMQTGHPCITTFHAGSVTKVIQRFTGDPINVPKSFMDNLDFVLIQMAVERKGKRLRRVLSVDEIEGYNKAVDGVMSRTAFEWKSAEDQHVFRANRNSFILEERIAKNAGYNDPNEIYDEYDLRKHILDRMVEEQIFDYYEVCQFIWTFYREGIEALPISI
ncbi:MAG: type II/IV secretion system ATPase subunit [Candidatus Thermoplasmatota archaeon]|nr:type II/IV secretion system ATPase subunit [Candidatus Thermoplasmatota archaeon]